MIFVIKTKTQYPLCYWWYFLKWMRSLPMLFKCYTCYINKINFSFLVQNKMDIGLKIKYFFINFCALVKISPTYKIIQTKDEKLCSIHSEKDAYCLNGKRWKATQLLVVCQKFNFSFYKRFLILRWSDIFEIFEMNVC